MNQDKTEIGVHLQALHAARLQHARGAGAVLDLLRRAVPDQAAALERDLAQLSGVTVLEEQAAFQLDTRALDLPTARSWRCAVVNDDQGQVWLAAEDPWDEELISRVTRRIGRAISPAAVTRSRLDDWLLTSEPTKAGPETGAGPITAGASGPIVDFVDAAVQAAYRSGASDIHFECDRRGVGVKHRRDGVMVRFARLEGVQSAQEVISRIKVLAQLDITERRLPQDGRFRWQTQNSSDSNSVDLRVSIMPSVFGEDAVLRLLDKAQLRSREEKVTLDLLGFDIAQAQLIRDLANEPSGMLLVTGPTGSGKTTTVYAALSEINTGLEKIITIEDPVEYELPGVLQIPVNERKGLTFAKGLRSILRHDPDRILIGEIRDAETAEIAVQSALTGHLVFSTVHANTVADIMGRFRHFGLDMFGLMSALNGVVVQRLARRLCPACAQSRALIDRERLWMSQHAQPNLEQVRHAIGCGQCQGTGYRGRFVIAEVHVTDDALRDLVTEGAPVSAVKRHAIDQGVVSLANQAAALAAEGQTSMEEIKRVVGWL